MKVLVACEFSGIVRDAFLAKGHDAISCDLRETEAPGPHIVGDVSPLLKEPWDLVIAHPPCDYLANCGARWRAERDEQEEIDKAVAFFKECLDANAPLVAVENPVMSYSVERIGFKSRFSVQPWQFGDNQKKRICFWTKGLPELLPTSNLNGYGAEAKVHREAPGPERKKNRARFFPKVAEAMADQWGEVRLLI